MANTHASDKIREGGRVENISNHSVAFHLVEATFRTACHDSTSILPAVLKQSETFVQLRSSRASLSEQKSDDSAYYTSQKHISVYILAIPSLLSARPLTHFGKDKRESLDKKRRDSKEAASRGNLGGGGKLLSQLALHEQIQSVCSVLLIFYLCSDASQSRRVSLQCKNFDRRAGSPAAEKCRPFVKILHRSGE